METKAHGDQRIVLHNVSWDTYERLLEERGESRVPRFAYDRGAARKYVLNPHDMIPAA